MATGVLLFCFNTEHYSYDKIAAKTIPLIKKNLGLPVTVVTNNSTQELLKKSLSDGINYKVIDNEIGNSIDNKPWHNLDRFRAYDISTYETTFLLDIDYFCFTNNLLTYADCVDDFLIHDQVHDLTGGKSYDFRQNSIIPMLWATVIIFRKTPRARAIFHMVEHIKKHYQYYCSLYRIDFRNFRNDYAFSMACHQVDGFLPTKKLPTKLPTLPAWAKVLEVNDEGLAWQSLDKSGKVINSDVHVIDKGVAYV